MTMLGYYPLENLAWAGYIAPRLFPVDADKLCQVITAVLQSLDLKLVGRLCGILWYFVGLGEF